MAQRHLPALLIIMDGCGLAPADGENAVAAAKTPFLDSLYEKYPHTTLGASGEDVGLPDGQMGNSGVGHLNIGAGRIVFQEHQQRHQGWLHRQERGLRQGYGRRQG